MIYKFQRKKYKIVGVSGQYQSTDKAEFFFFGTTESWREELYKRKEKEYIKGCQFCFFSQTKSRRRCRCSRAQVSISPFACGQSKKKKKKKKVGRGSLTRQTERAICSFAIIRRKIYVNMRLYMRARRPRKKKGNVCILRNDNQRNARSSRGLISTFEL